jgi:hypothetical protein
VLNGFASAVATVGATILAMVFGFTVLLLSAAGCYAIAALVAFNQSRTARL